MNAFTVDLGMLGESTACITGDTLVGAMADASIRDLRNRGGEIVDRAAAGEDVTITRDGKPVAELRAIPGQALSSTALLARWRGLPPVDPQQLRADVDATIDPAA